MTPKTASKKRSASAEGNSQPASKAKKAPESHAAKQTGTPTLKRRRAEAGLADSESKSPQKRAKVDGSAAGSAASKKSIPKRQPAASAGQSATLSSSKKLKNVSFAHQ